MRSLSGFSPVIFYLIILFKTYSSNQNLQILKSKIRQQFLFYPKFKIKYQSPFLAFTNKGQSNFSITKFDTQQEVQSVRHNQTKFDLWNGKSYIQVESKLVDGYRKSPKSKRISPQRRQSPLKNQGLGNMEQLLNPYCQQKSGFTKGLISSQLKIDQAFRNPSPKHHQKSSYVSQRPKTSLDYGDQVQYQAKSKNYVLDAQLNRSRERIDKFKTLDADLDLQLKQQRNSIEKRILGQKQQKQFSSTSTQSWYADTSKGERRITTPTVPIQDIIRMTNRLGEITISEIPRLNSSYIAELQAMQGSISRLIQQSTKRSRY